MATMQQRMPTLQLGSLKAIKEALIDKYCYGKINLVRAHLQTRNQRFGKKNLLSIQT